MSFLPVSSHYFSTQNSLQLEQPAPSFEETKQQGPSSSEISNISLPSEGKLNPQMVLRDLIRQQQIINACEVKTESVAFIDPHSFAKPTEAIVTHLDIDIKFDLLNEILQGTVSIDFINLTGTEKLHLDIKGLKISAITDESGDIIEWSFGEKDELLGQDLEIHIPKDQKQGRIKIYYSTSQDAEGLYWNVKEPDNFLLYSHSQPTYTRSWLPCQDTPQVRSTYTATITTDSRWLAVMSCSNNPKERNDTGVYKLEMNIPIPSYLMAFCVGNIEFKETGARTGIYAHPGSIEKAFNEYEDLENVLIQAENMLGEYRWGRYDMLILPVDFPAGATENPMISFFSSMVIPGDKSLAYYLYHELAHSWSGNYTTAKGWEHLWLNEGMTTYFELRLAEQLKDKNYSEMIAKTYYNELEETIAEDETTSCLRMHLAGKNPRDSFTSIPYYKGYFFLRMLEESFGRVKFDLFLKNYFKSFEFQSITTEEFENYLFSNLFENNRKLAKTLQIKDWLYRTGLPSNCPEVKSELIALVEKTCENWLQYNDINTLQEEAQTFTAQQWIYFTQTLKKKILDCKGNHTSILAQLDETFEFRNHSNLTIRDEWLITAVELEYTACYPYVKSYVLEACKPKIVKKFMNQLVQTSEGLQVALEIYEAGKSSFYPRSRSVAESIIKNSIKNQEKTSLL